MISRTVATGLLLAAVLGVALPPAHAGCPDAATLLERLQALDLQQGARSARFGIAAPAELHEKAARHVGRPFARHHDKQSFGVIVAELPVERLWKAVNDEDHHADYLPLRHSEVIGGTPRGDTRLLFQYFHQMGIGRWWVSQVAMSRPLFERSRGTFWEVVWEDRMETVDPEQPPFDSVSSKMAPIVNSHGAWLLVPLAERCTLVEHFSSTEPGGLAGAAQPLVAHKALRNTVRGLVRLAEEHLTAPHPGARFVRPDGTALD